MALIIIAFFLVLLRDKLKIKYALIVLGSWCMFAFCIPWQPWITRLQVPLFALSAPVFAQALENINYLKPRKIILVFFCCCSLLPLFFNESRSLALFTREKTIWNTKRDELVFNNRKDLYVDYVNACIAIAGTDTSQLGLIIGGDSWEYPLWRYLRHNMEIMPKIIHVKPESIGRNIDVLFILDRKDVPFIQNSINDPEDNGPLVLQHDDINEWDVLR
jgi:hypothetical protein